MLSARAAAVVALVCSFGLAACLKDRSTTCGDLLCPAGTVCAPDSSRCVTAAQFAGCSGLHDGDDCTLGDVTTAQCLGGVCSPVVCGDGLLMRGEACDDGNTRSCDGCSADCRSTEGCGNGIVECAEQCDRGANNSNAANADCRVDCRRQRCGDGVVDDRSGEDCDGAAPANQNCTTLGFYGGTLSCSAACRADVTACVGSCGDGQVQGAELCDGAPPSGRSCLDFGYDLGNLYCSSLCTPSFATCERMGFTPMNGDGVGGVYANTAWGDAPNDVFVAGYDGVIIRYDGTRWARMTTPLTETLYGLGGTGPNDVWAVGKNGAVEHFDGGTWSTSDAGVSVQLNAVWAVSPRDVFIAGRTEQLADGGATSVVLRGDGTTWVRQNIPRDIVGDAVRITGLWASSANDVFATATGAVFHFNGSSWSLMTLPPSVAGTLELYAVWGSGPADVYAAGEVLIHYDGTSWSTLSLGVPAFLTAIDGTGPNDVWVVAEGGLVFHFDGVGFSRVPSGTTQALYGLSARADQVIAAGPGTLVQFLAGSPTMSVGSTGQTGNVSSVWGLAENDLFAATTDGEISHFDGRAWTAMTSGTTQTLWAVWGSRRDDVFAVGENGTILHFNGTTWSPMAANAGTATLNWVWGTSATNVYAVGSGGTAVHFNGTTWSAITTNVTSFLYGVWGSSAQDVFVVGDNGTVLHFDGQGWSSLDTGTTLQFWGAWGSGPRDVYVFGDSGGVLHYDGTRFTASTTNSINSFDYGAGTSATDVFALEFHGQGLFHSNGVDWAQLRVPTTTNYSLWSSRSVAYVGATAGQLVRVDRHCAQHEHRCADRWDDDCDGALNCADSDCDQDPTCRTGGLCQTLTNLTCGAVVTGSTAGGSPQLERYACATETLTGRERAYAFVAPATGDVTLTLTSMIPEQRLVVLGSFASGGCDPLGACLGVSTGASGARRVTFHAVAGKRYSVLVDAVGSASGSFSLEVVCP
jgi:cysteine-rich repeat protein